ncbi:MAG: type I DNA topoisomerase [Aggregatilineales bacterium]
MTNLVIVESPAKAKKIAGFLGDGWQVEACRGHVRDLPEAELGVVVDKDFQPQYQVLPGKNNLVRKLVKAMREADAIYLATDPDREGEAIAWHLLELAGNLKGKAVYRSAFNAITKYAVQSALKNPRSLDEALVEAQQARRVVDRLVGYLVSPLACKALDGKLSAGRVQSVALRLVVEREKQIEAFNAETYWTLCTRLEADGVPFDAILHRLKDRASQSTRITFPVRDTPEKLISLLQSAKFWVDKSGTTQKPRQPLPPFTTSSLQQAASKGLGLSPEKTMSLAQTLYEQGRITYHRTDAVHVAPEAQVAARNLIQRDYGEAYLPPTPPTYKTQVKSAQEAHEAIRPTDLTHLPEENGGDGAKLYALIWKRFIASQMAPAQYSVTAALIHAGKSTDKPFPLVFKASGRKLIFDGFLRVYEEPDDGDDEENTDPSALPALTNGQPLKLIDLPLDEGQTRPSSRFSEAGLVQKLEALGVGRPSTFASMVGVIKSKKYVTLKQKRLIPTETGMKLCDFTVNHFPKVFDVGYTARLEMALDKVASGDLPRLDLLNTFWRGFQPQLKTGTEFALAQIKARPQATPLGESCPECGGDLVERQGAQGAFVGCSNYPTCTYTRKVEHKPLVLHPAED